MIMFKKLDKSKARLECHGTILAEHIFKEEMQGYLDELMWGFLKKGMAVHPHNHPQKEVYIFIKGNGKMRVDKSEISVGEGDVLFVPSNVTHTAWNVNDKDLEFIIVRVRNLNYWVWFIKRLFSH